MTGTTTAPGILPLAVQDCFDYVSSGQKDELREYLLRISYLEIYNEQIIDLLSDTPTAVRIFESPKEGVVVRGLREEVVTSPHDVHHWIAQGELKRQVGSTNMNKHSSRSHAIFRLWIESKCPDGGVRVSSLSLVDLAGSESVRLTGSTGDRQKEGQYINKSLTTLGQVVFKLSELQRRHDDTTKAHIPYRDSKLTRLLQPSLSGNAQIVLISCISPQVSHLQESHNTLKFAVRAKRIQQYATVSEVADEKTMCVYEK
jgi:centromeric protein E